MTEKERKIGEKRKNGKTEKWRGFHPKFKD